MYTVKDRVVVRQCLCKLKKDKFVGISNKFYHNIFVKR